MGNTLQGSRPESCPAASFSSRVHPDRSRTEACSSSANSAFFANPISNVLHVSQPTPSSVLPHHTTAQYEPSSSREIQSLHTTYSTNAFHPPRGGISMDVCIFKVPRRIYDSKPEAYKPSLISLGLRHLGGLDPNLIMDVCKDDALERTLHRLQMNFQELLRHMESLKPNVRRCYDEIAWYSAKHYCLQSQDDFMGIITKDACFLLEFLRVPDATTQERHMSIVFYDNGERNIFRGEIMNDILKMENQIPMIVLRRILELEKGSIPEALHFLCISLRRFAVFQGFPFCNVHYRYFEDSIDKASHLLDLCRLIIHRFLTDIPPDAISISVNVQEQPHKPIRCASKLRNAGIVFEKNAEGHGSVRFEEGGWKSARLFLPEIIVDDIMDTVLRNLMALEECLACKFDPPSKTICHYVRLMNKLVDTAEDVDVLKKKGIIQSMMGSDKEVAEMFNSHCVPVLLCGWGEYETVILNVARHYDSPWKACISKFKDRYVKQPWYKQALIVVLLPLIFSAIQTYYAIV